MDLKTAQGKTLKRLRKERNITLRTLSKKSYVSLGYISNIETGQRNSTPDIFERLIKGLDIEPEQFYTELVLTYKKGKENG